MAYSPAQDVTPIWRLCTLYYCIPGHLSRNGRKEMKAIIHKINIVVKSVAYFLGAFPLLARPIIQAFVHLQLFVQSHKLTLFFCQVREQPATA